MEKRERNYTWYLQPADKDANKALSMAIPEENFHAKLPHNGPEDVWECSPRILRAFRSEEKGKSRFKLFCQEGNGKVREVPFLLSGRKRKMAFALKKKAVSSAKPTESHSAAAVS